MCRCMPCMRIGAGAVGVVTEEVVVAALVAAVVAGLVALVAGAGAEVMLAVAVAAVVAMSRPPPWLYATGATSQAILPGSAPSLSRTSRRFAASPAGRPGTLPSFAQMQGPSTRR